MGVILMENPKQNLIEIIEPDNETKDIILFIPQKYEEIAKENPSLIKEVEETEEELLNDIVEEEKNNGDWFIKVVQKVIETHSENVNYEYFRNKYNEIPKDMIAKKIIEANLNISIIIGMMSGASGGILGIFSSIPVTFGEIITLTYYQVKMIYDLSVVYGKPVNMKDPEEAYKVLAIALGIKINHVAKGAINQGINQGGKIILEGFGKRKVLKPIQNSLSKLGIEIAQKSIKNIASKAIPVLGIATGAVLCSYLDYISTNSVAMNTLSIYRLPKLIIEYFESLNKISKDNLISNKALAKGCFVMANSDHRVDLNKTILIDYIKQYRLVDDSFWDELKDRLKIRDKEFFDDLEPVTDKKELESIYNALMLVALSDRKVSQKERQILLEFVPRLNISGKELERDLRKLRKDLYAL